MAEKKIKSLATFYLLATFRTSYQFPINRYHINIATFEYLFMYYLAPTVIYSMFEGWNVKKRKTCLERSRYGLGIVNVSARQAALIRWTATDKLDMKNGFSRVSRHISQTPSDLCQEFISTTLIRPRVSWAIGEKSWVRQSELYLFVFLTAAIFIYLCNLKFLRVDCRSSR